MPDFPFETEFVVGDETQVVLRSTNEASRFLRTRLRQLPDPRWEVVSHRFDVAKTEQDAAEAANALRELLMSENLLRAERQKG